MKITIIDIFFNVLLLKKKIKEKLIVTRIIEYFMKCSLIFELVIIVSFAGL